MTSRYFSYTYYDYVYTEVSTQKKTKKNTSIIILSYRVTSFKSQLVSATYVSHEMKTRLYLPPTFNTHNDTLDSFFFVPEVNSH